MKNLTLISLLFLLVSTNNVTVASERPVASERNILAEYLESICVKVRVKDSMGSGTAFTRKDWTGTNDITFIWTAAHLFGETPDLFSMLFLGQNRTNTPVADHAMIILPIFDKDGAVCGSTNRLARIIKYSDSHSGQDLALLQLDGPYFNTNNVVFDLSDKPTRIGTRVISVAAPYGLTGTYSEGHISMVGNSISSTSNIFDQTSCVVFPGSSGSGLFNAKGVYIGMITMMRAPNLNFMIPMRRIHDWARKENIEWALDPKIPMPSKEQFDVLRVADFGRTNPPVRVTVINRSSPTVGTNNIPQHR